MHHFNHSSTSPRVGETTCFVHYDTIIYYLHTPIIVLISINVVSYIATIKLIRSVQEVRRNNTR